MNECIHKQACMDTHIHTPYDNLVISFNFVIALFYAKNIFFGIGTIYKSGAEGLAFTFKT